MSKMLAEDWWLTMEQEVIDATPRSEVDPAWRYGIPPATFTSTPTSRAGPRISGA